MLAAALALAASVGWGSADYIGGLKSRQFSVLTVLLTTQTVAFCLIAIAAVITGAGISGADFVVYATLSAVAQTVAMIAYYRGLSIGAMGIVAPISALAGLVPVVVGLASGERPTAVQGLGVAFAVTGVLLASYEPSGARATGKRTAAGVGMALLAALGFGCFYVFIDAASDRGDITSAVLINRTVALSTLLIAWAIRRGGTRLSALRAGDLAQLFVVGALAIGASYLFALATTKGLVSLVAVLAALYPVTTIVCARVLLKERLSLAHRLGGAFALLGVALIAA